MLKQKLQQYLMPIVLVSAVLLAVTVSFVIAHREHTSSAIAALPKFTRPSEVKQDPSLPVVPADTQKQFQTLLLRQARLQQKYQEFITSPSGVYLSDLSNQIGKTQVEGTKLQNDMLDALKLDKNKYTTALADDGNVIIIKR